MATLTTSQADAFGATVAPKVQRILLIALLFAALPVIAAILYRGTERELSDAVLQALRRSDVIYLLAEGVVCLIAFRSGVRLSSVWSGCPVYVRALLTIFLATFAVSSLFVSEMPLTSLGRSVQWLLHLVFAACVFQLFRGTSRTIADRFAVCLSAGMLVYVPILIVHVSTNWSEIVEWTYAMPGYANVRSLGHVLTAMAAIPIAMFLRSPGKDRRWQACLAAMIVILMSTLLWTGSRAAVYGLGCALVAGTLFGGVRLPASRLIPLAGLLLISFCIAYANLPDSDSFRLIRDGNSDFGSGRTTIWLSALSHIAERPIWGWGAGAAHWLIEVGGRRFTEPHNVILQFALSWGVIAACAAFALLASAWFAMMRALRHDATLYPYVLMTNCLLAMSLVDGVLFRPHTIALIFIGFAVCLARDHDRRGQPVR
ncbi:MAG: O-antigen ligase family protein [Pseudomonadota bacterium]